MASPKNLIELLESTAAQAPEKGIIAYAPGQTTTPSPKILYSDLLSLATQNAELLLQDKSLQAGSIVLLALNSHTDALTWFWATIAAGLIPAICGPLPNDLSARGKHFAHLHETLQNPLTITTKDNLSAFDCQDVLNIKTVEDIQSAPASSEIRRPSSGSLYPEQIACLMLTSGSTGNAKAVPIRHGQVIKAVAGKSKYHGTTKDQTFLNWIGLDHVANLTEVHLHALSLGADQVHIQAADLMTNPLAFTDALSRHKVSYSFAPNFFMAKLERTLALEPSYKADLSSLHAFISGGEANPVTTVAALSRYLIQFGAAPNAIRPGFGMTETCAGSIYGIDCPKYDLQNGHEFASLGKCIPGIEMRVVAVENELQEIAKGEVGSLQVRGEIVFNGYFNNPAATEEAFSADGWFKTGDKAYIDKTDSLVLAGRTKDTIIINGVKYLPHEVEVAIEDAGIEGVRDGYTVVFPHRRPGQNTEDICVVFLPSFASDDALTRVQATDAITRVVAISTGAKPFEIVPLNEQLLQKSSLGKLSRNKIKAAYEKGEYDEYRKIQSEEVTAYRQLAFEQLDPHLETEIASVISTMFDIPMTEMGAHTSVMDLGVSSIELIMLKQKLQAKFELQDEIPVTKLITEPTVRSMATLIEELMNFADDESGPAYDPVVVLSKTGSKAPLWLVHPGVGEVLVFVPLGKYITDRPVYALRARGFGRKETLFTSIPEIVESYMAGIKRNQPRGPYCISGYSYGAMLAFEVSKALIANGDEVAFTGSFNLPPHIAFRMQQLEYPSVLLHLAYFVGLITEDKSEEMSDHMHSLPDRKSIMDALMVEADKTRMQELDLDPVKIENWANIAHNLQALARTYEPTGKLVNGIDVFVAIPLRAVAPDREYWIKHHLSRWAEHCEDEGSDGLRLHHVNGSHYTMMGPDNVESFVKILKKALNARGV